MCCNDDIDLPKAGGYPKLTTAKKPHKCCECGTFILPPEKYFRVDGIWSDGAASFKICLSCEALREKWEQEGESAPAYGYLEDCLFECGFVDSDDEDAQGAYCSIRTTVPWLSRSRGGRFELVEVRSQES